MVTADPFKLFPRQVEPATLWRYHAPGQPREKIAADIPVIIKRTTGTDAPAGTYENRVATRRAHLKPSALPSIFILDPDRLVSHVLEDREGNTFLITGVSRGDDMTRGTTTFLTVTLQPYANESL